MLHARYMHRRQRWPEIVLAVLLATAGAEHSPTLSPTTIEAFGWSPTILKYSMVNTSQPFKGFYTSPSWGGNEDRDASLE